jgi:trigger factor
MPDAVKTIVTELPESRVRVEAEVPAAEVERRMQATARQMGRDLRMPGFRKGKVPPPVVIQRMGRDTVLDETVRGALGRWYLDAIDAAGIHPVGEPSLDLGELPGAGEPLTFTIEIAVRPTAELGRYKGVEAPRREPGADDEAIDAEIEALRERMARLETVDEPAASGDFIVMDHLGTIDGVPFDGGEGRDQLVELGSGRLVEGFEAQLLGAVAREQRTVNITFPDDYAAEHLAGKPAQFAITVNEVKRKELPALDDDFASDSAGFDTIAELREDVAAKLKEADENKVEAEFREAVLDAVVADSKIEIPQHLIDARAGELWERMLHSLSHQGITKEAYLRMAERSEEEVLDQAKPDAEQALRREAVIAAVIEAESIDPTDGDVLDALQSTAAQEGTTPEKLRQSLERSGQLETVREDLAQRRAVELLAAEAKPISAAQAKVREQIWTPDREKREGDDQPAPSKLWTPGS